MGHIKSARKAVVAVGMGRRRSGRGAIADEGHTGTAGWVASTADEGTAIHGNNNKIWGGTGRPGRVVTTDNRHVGTAGQAADVGHMGTTGRAADEGA